LANRWRIRHRDVDFNPGLREVMRLV